MFSTHFHVFDSSFKQNWPSSKHFNFISLNFLKNHIKIAICYHNDEVVMYIKSAIFFEAEFQVFFLKASCC